MAPGQTLMKNIVVAASLAVAMGHGLLASADTLTGALTASASAVNVHSIGCAAGTYLLSTQVRNDSASTPKLSAQTNKGAKATNTTDPASGDSGFSPEAILANGSGTYFVTVSKSGAGAASYTLEYSCRSFQDALVPTAVTEVVDEGQTAYNALNIQQGCRTGLLGANGTEKIRPVIAESVVLPGDDATSDSFRSDTGAPVNLSDVIANANGLAGLVEAVQIKTLFPAQGMKFDGSGNSIGFHGSKGKLQTNLTGRVPFRFTAPTFKPESCAKRLLVKIAVADICQAGATKGPGQVNLWIPNDTAKFMDSNAIPGSDGTPHSGLPATLIVNRTSALDAGCGAGFDVTVWPTDAHVDAHLPIPGYWTP